MLEEASAVDASTPSTDRITSGVDVVYDEALDKEMEYFPDPPCVLPAEDDENDVRPEAKKSTGTNAQAYWKNFALWQQEDPKLMETRNVVQMFVDAFTEKVKANAMRRAGTVRSMAAPSKVGLGISKSGTASRSGDLVLVEAYVNISVHSVGIRKDATKDEAAKTGRVIRSGQPILVERIIEAPNDGVRYLKIPKLGGDEEGGWVFDSLGGNNVLFAKMEDIEVCSQWHRITCKELVDIRRCPVYDDVAKTGRLMSPKEMAVVNIKCRVRGAPFVHLADGRGWVFVKKPGTAKKAISWGEAVIEECDQEIVDGDKWLDVSSILPATNEACEVGMWTYVVGRTNVLCIGSKMYGTYIASGDVIKVNKRAWSLGDPPQDDGTPVVRWLRLSDGRGWVPQHTMDGKELMTERKESLTNYPAHFKGTAESRNLDKPSRAWMVGLL